METTTTETKKSKRTTKAEPRSTKWEKLQVELSNEDRLARASQLSDLLRKKDSLDEQKKIAADGFKSEIAKVEAEITNVSNAIATGKEERELEVWEDFQFETNTVNIRRCDTDAVVKTRAVTLAERQRLLPGLEEPKAKKNGNGAKEPETKPETPEAKADERPTAESLPDADSGDPLAGTPLEDGPHDINAQEMPTEVVEDTEVEKPKRGRKGRRS